MTGKRILGIVCFIAGIVLIFISMYIMKQVEEGKVKISSAQETVDSSKRLFNLNPVTKEVGKGITSSAQRKIDAGRSDVAHYTQVASTLKIVGIILIIIGVFLFIWGRKKKV